MDWQSEKTLGAAIGVATGNVPVGVAIGVALGVAIGSGIGVMRNKDDSKKSPESDQHTNNG